MATERSRALLAHPLPGDEVVISGIAGYFPKSDSVMELQANLFNKVDLVSDITSLSNEISIKRKFLGKINTAAKFDQASFGISYAEAHRENPGNRILLERTFEAIIDAGINPVELRNTRTGVFVGCCFDQSQEMLLYEKIQANNTGIIGCSGAMLAIRISNWLKVTGPAYKMDTACSSSMYALEQAFKVLLKEPLDYAIVAGVNLNLLNHTESFDNVRMLSKDGRCKSFDNSADGFGRSEGAVVCVLQKAKNARRIYAQVVYSKTMCDGYKEEGLLHPSLKEQEHLLKDFYEECSIPPQSVQFVECHGTGTPIGDAIELKALQAVVCSGRTDPLLIGSVKSNMAHGESAAALCSIVKLCIAYNTGYIAPNINFWKAREDVPALIEGRIQVITNKHLWNRGLAAVNSFGMGGSIAHTLLKNIAKDKKYNGLSQDDLPKLICTSGRTHAAVARIIESLESKTIDVEEVRLWHAIHEHNIEGHGFRGYTLLSSTTDILISLSKDIRRFFNTKRNIIYFYSGTISKWTSIDTRLMKIPIFAAAIKRCHEILKPKDIDLINILNGNDSELTMLNSNIGITAVQIALTIVLTAIGIKPDYMKGHGVGEIACAYADSCLTLEQAILVAYYRGMACTEVIDAERNYDYFLGSSERKIFCTLKAGEMDNGNGIFSNYGNKPGVEETNTIKAWSNFDYIGVKLLENLKEVISLPKVHSDRWISTSDYTDQCELAEPCLCSAEYFTRNFMEEIPDTEPEQCQILSDYLQIDFTPPSKCDKHFQENLEDHVLIEVLRGRHQNGLENFFDALGEMFLAGLNPLLANLYPDVPFPVSLGTPMLSHLVEWDHREEWITNPYINKFKYTSMERIVVVNVEEEKYLNGHIVDGRVLYPGTGYLVLVWETLALMMEKPFQQVSVVFENVSFKRSTLLPKTGKLEFIVTIHRTTGEFEITEKNSTVVTGRVHVQTDLYKDFNKITDGSCEATGDVIHMSSKDFYKVMRLKGYGHSGDFQRITGCNIEGTYFEVSWIDNWVVMLDSILQTLIIISDISILMLPTRIEKIVIDVSAYNASLRALTDNKIIKVYGDRNLKIVRTPGIEIRGVHFTSTVKRPILISPVLEDYVHIPFEEDKPTQLEKALRVNIQLIIENVQAYTLRIVEVIDEEYKKNAYESLSYSILNIMRDQSLGSVEITVNSNELIKFPCDVKVNNDLSKCKNSVLVIGANLCENVNTLEQCEKILRDQCFIMSREKLDFPKTKYLNDYNIISYTNTGTEYLVLLRKQKKHNEFVFIEIKMDGELSWIDKVKEQINRNGIIVLYSEDECSGILGFVNCLRKEPGGENVRGVFIKDTSAPTFNPELEFYRQQLEKNLTINVYENGQWGSYRHILLTNLDQIAEVDNAYIDIETKGKLSSLKWFEGSLDTNKQIEPDFVLVHVYCASLNFRDVMFATERVALNDDVPAGKMESHDYQGCEFVGRTANGTRVMGSASKTISNIVKAQLNLIMAIPDEWSFEEAATVFIAYFTAYTGLIVFGKLKCGESVLIHAGSGAVGQAAINVALSYGCEVFTTVGTTDKRAMIKKLYPQIKDSNIGSSRDTSFEEMIRRETKGKGVDVVLNSLADDLLLATTRCLGFRGRFVEIGKFDIYMNTPIQIHFYQNEISFHGLMLDQMLEDKYADIRQVNVGLILVDIYDRTLELLAKGIISGTVRPLTYCVFDKDEVISAYMYMATAKHIGKVVIKLRNEEPNETRTVITPLKMQASIRRYTCNLNSVYVLVGGLGGFGMEVANWLTVNGAKILVFVSRTGITNGYQAWKIRNWKSRGVVVEISTHDVTSEEGCKQMLESANSMGVVVAVFNFAMVLKDLTFEHHTRDTFEVAYAPKASIAIHLDKLTRILCPALKNFVMFSSYTCGRGTAGQTNYGLANSVMERICEKRKKEGLPALAIQWGVIGDVGYIMENKLYNDGIMKQQNIASCLFTLEKFLKQNNVIVSTYIPSDRKIKTDRQMGVDVIANIMGIHDLKSISYQMTLAELGMDSIVAMEIKQTLERDSEIFLNAKEIRSLTFERLTELLGDKETSSKIKTRQIDATKTLLLRVLLKQFGDESTANVPFMYLPTSIDDKYDGKEICSDSENVIFMVPGSDGCAATFNLLCRQLKTKACVLQLELDRMDDNIPAMVDRLYEILKSQFNPMVPFNLLGYSYGTILALELAARLENEGLKGTVYCIDGSPQFCKNIISKSGHLKESAELQNYIITFMVEFVALDKNLITMANIEKIELFEDKIDYALKLLPDGVNYPGEYMKRMIKAFYNRINALYDYNPNDLPKLKSTIVLIRTENVLLALPDSYGLDKLTDNNLTIHYIKSDHLSIVDEEQCARIINNIIEKPY